MRHNWKRWFGIMFTLALLLGLMPGMSMIALADDTTGTQITDDMTNLTEGTYYISSDTTINGELQVSAGTVVINLNGHTLNQNSNNTTSVIYVSGGNLTVNNGTITGGDGGHDKRGGGFHVDGGSVIVNNVTISDNTGSWGGGVFMKSGSFTMNDSHIDYNHSVTDGNNYHDAGGVYLDGGTFTMNGGTIQNNTVTADKKNGVCLANDSARLNISGDAVIYNNKDGDAQENLFAVAVFGGASPLYITGELGSKAKIGITSDLYQVFTKSENTDYNDPTKFVSDNSAYRVGKNDAGQLMLVESTTQLITAANVTATYGDTDKSVSATTDGGGTISYAVKDGSKDYIDVNSSTGALTIKAVPADGKAYVTVTASATSNYGEATKDVTVTIGKATATIGHEDKSTTFSSDGISIPIEGMFTIPTGAGEPTYSVTNGTGEGSYENGKLTVTKCGTFTVTVNTAESSTHVAGNASATLTVNKPNAVPATVDANNRTSDGTPQPLVKPGSVEGGTMYYALGSNSTTAPADGWSTEVPTATEAGTYYVWYKVVGDANHNDVDPACVVVLKTSGKKAFKMRWTAVPGAEGYDVFFGMCNKGDCQLLASVNGTSYKIKGLKKGFAYKGYVWAWKNVGGAKTYIGEPSPDVHAITNGKSNHYTNPKKISVKKKKLTVGVGKRKAIKAKLKKFSDSRNYLNHVSAKIRYYSSDRTVATVDAKGRVTGVGPGRCTVFAVAENGLRVGVKVTVK